jgi:hypothetical protein
MSTYSASAPGINYNFPSVIGGTGTGVKIFPDMITSTNAAALKLPVTAQGWIFTLNFAGTVKLHGTSPTLIPTLQYNTSTPSLTSTNNTTVSALTSAQLFSSTGASYPWAATFKLQGDSTSQIIQVISATWSANGTTSTTFTNTSMTSITWTGATSDGNTFAPTLPQFCFGLNFGVSDSVNSASCYEFNLEF